MYRAVVTCLLCLCLATPAAVVATTDSDFQISMADSITIPDRTYTFSGTDLVISAFATVSIGNEFTASVTAPDSSTEYTLYLYNRKKNIVDAVRLTGSDTATFPTEPLSPGTYILVVNGPDGNFRAGFPVVVANHDVQVSVSDTVNIGETLSISATVSQRAGTAESAQTVEAVVVDGQESTRVTLTETDDGTYEGSLSIGEAGDYRVYVVVRGSQTLSGDNETELLGASSVYQVTVQEPTATPTATRSPTATSSPTETPSPTATETGSDGGSGTGGSTGGGTTATATSTPTATRTPTASPSATPPRTATPPSATATATSSPTTADGSPPTTSPQTTVTESLTSTSATPSQTPTARPTATATPSNVVTPNPTATATSTQDTAVSTPVGLPAVIATLLGILLLLRGRRS